MRYQDQASVFKQKRFRYFVKATGVGHIYSSGYQAVAEF
jgi:hypothetical protein